MSGCIKYIRGCVADWDKTILMKKRLGEKLQHSGGKEFYQGRPVIHRDSEVDGGVYLGQGQREAIVVDSKKYPMLNELYREAKEMATVNGVVQKDKVLSAVYKTVEEHLKPNERAVDLLLIKYGVENDGKVSLDTFIKEKVGICRHDALASAALLEHFKKDGYISGKASVDRNATNAGGHAWCRYTNSAGEIFILDVAQKFLGKLKDAKGQNRWEYERPEEF